jgi:hypothetical protein
MQMSLAIDVGDRDEVALGSVGAPRSYPVDLGCGVCRPHVSTRCMAARAGAHHHDVVLSVRPLALSSHQPGAEIEHEVVSQSVNHRLEHRDANEIAAAVTCASAIAPFWFVDSTTEH